MKIRVIQQDVFVFDTTTGKLVKDVSGKPVYRVSASTSVSGANPAGALSVFASLLSDIADESN